MIVKTEAREECRRQTKLWNEGLPCNVIMHTACAFSLVISREIEWCHQAIILVGWRSTVVERRYFTDELPCPALHLQLSDDRPLKVIQPSQLSLSSIRGR